VTDKLGVSSDSCTLQPEPEPDTGYRTPDTGTGTHGDLVLPPGVLDGDQAAPRFAVRLLEGEELASALRRESKKRMVFQ
jgi:hypothetical protein